MPADRCRRLLVRAPNWLGDAVMSLPAVRAAREQCDELIVMAIPPLAELYDGIAGASVDSRLPLRRAVAEVRRLAPDAVLLLQNSLYSAMVPRLAGCREIWGYRKNGRGFLLSRPIPAPPDVYARHQVYYFWDLVRALGWADGDPALCMDVRGDSELQPGECFIGMSPGAHYGEAKRWPPESFGALGRSLSERGFRIVLFGGPSEARNCAAIAAAIGRSCIDLAGRTSVRALIAGISRCRVFVTNDSGPLHIASALRVPVVAIFGSTEPRSTGPFNPPSIVLRRDLPCSPCHRRSCPIDHRCMTRIPPEEVLPEVLSLAGQSPSISPGSSGWQRC
ncbi:MAG: lipopolysaccharide heptosyltransferase II [Acidobacteriota bacterium]